MTPNTNDFSNKGIKCDDWQQMLHLSRLAEAQGYKAAPTFTDWDFAFNPVFFAISSGSSKFYANGSEPTTETIVSYADFVTQTEPVPSVDQLTASWNA